jgi:hypothetical protein
MSHLCDTFFYVNLKYSLEQVKNSIQAQLQKSKKVEIVSIEIDESFNEITHFDLHYQYQNHLRQAFQFLNPQEKSEYNSKFIPEQFENKWLITVKLRRQSTGHLITLYYFTGEGLASYVALSSNGKYAPRVLCTIQTGGLERPNGVLTRLLQNFEQRPMLWIRGFEETHNYASYSNAFATDTLYNQIGLDFIDEWIVPESYLGFKSDNPTKRFCKGFITQNTHDENSAIHHIVIDKHTVHFDGIQNIEWNTEKRSALFISKKTHSKFSSELHKCDDFTFWENCLDSRVKLNNSKVCIDFLRKIDSLNKYSDIHFIPFGMEDEGKLFKEFFKENLNAEFHMYLHRPMDFYDLKFPQ